MTNDTQLRATLISKAQEELGIKEGTYKLRDKKGDGFKWVRVWINLYPKVKAYIGDLGEMNGEKVYTGTIRALTDSEKKRLEG